MSFRHDDSVARYGESFGGVARTSLSDRLNLMSISFVIELIGNITDTWNWFRVHENVVPLRAYYYHAPPNDQLVFLKVEIILVYDYYKKDSVHKMLHGKVKVDWDTRLRVAIGVARGIAFIHRQDNGTFFQGGIKSENIFLNAGNYGCISELGKCITGHREPYVKSRRGSLQESDVLLELVTGKYPEYGIGENFKTCIGSRNQLGSKVEYFIRREKINQEEHCFQLLDPELVKHYGELKGQLIEMLWIAWDCVTFPTRGMGDVVERLEGIGQLELSLEFLHPVQDVQLKLGQSHVTNLLHLFEHDRYNLVYK
ncbi:probable inactive receptor kinase At4g23740 [Papaver somniferum]|uniref:probable inactive receptor kinase At4g23740 n=1 Tax=Papaver somniferum TaxID=3469 RepID=UPI000E703BC5|nr:probable inactive receptor kinase At4g23740 [Papaver somniferum]